MAFATIAVDTAFQQIVLEQALGYAREMEKMLERSADGKVLDACETVSLNQGRALLRTVLTAAMQQQADPVEKKAARAVPVRADIAAVTKGGRPGRW
jgi:hypothetical protein